MNYVFGFEKLEVWQLTRELVVKIYRLTKLFPSEERYGLTSQMRRAAVSVASNIAEGSGRTSNKDQAHFYQLAYGSLMEVVSQIILSTDLEYMDEQSLIALKEKSREISNKLIALRRSALNSTK